MNNNQFPAPADGQILADWDMLDKFLRGVGPPPPSSVGFSRAGPFDAIPPAPHQREANTQQHHDNNHSYALPRGTNAEHQRLHSENFNPGQACPDFRPFPPAGPTNPGLPSVPSHLDSVPAEFRVRPVAQDPRQPQLSLPSLALLPGVSEFVSSSAHLAGPANPTLPPLAAWNFGGLPASAPQQPNSDDFLDLLDDHDFNLPSTTPQDLPLLQPQPRPYRWGELPDLLPTSSEPHFPSDIDLLGQGPSQASNNMPATRAAARAASEQAATHTPAPRRAKRTATATASDEVETLGTPAPGSRSAKRQRVTRTPDRSNASSSQKSEANKKHKMEVDTVFDSDAEEDVEVVNLVDDEDEQPEPEPEPPKQISATMLRFGTQSCVICFEDMTDIVVTHCGHTFCSGCLQAAIFADRSRSNCPICRQRIDSKQGQAHGPKTKHGRSFLHLEFKVMTANRQGKRPAAAASGS